MLIYVIISYLLPWKQNTMGNHSHWMITEKCVGPVGRGVTAASIHPSHSNHFSSMLVLELSARKKQKYLFSRCTAAWKQQHFCQCHVSKHTHICMYIVYRQTDRFKVTSIILITAIITVPTEHPHVSSLRPEQNPSQFPVKGQSCSLRGIQTWRNVLCLLNKPGHEVLPFAPSGYKDKHQR